MSIHYIQCSLFELENRVQTLVNPVNCEGFMGRGLALQFKQRYPEALFTAYQQRCQTGSLRVGRLYLWRPSRKATWILNFPTKDSWRKPATLEIIEAGLKHLVEIYKEAEISSIAFPMLGCGEGKLCWQDVQPLMERYLNQLEGVDVYIAFLPQKEERRTLLPRYFLNFLELGASALYQAEVNRLPDVFSLTVEQRQWLIARARANEDQARTDLMLCCLAYVLRRAAMIQEERRPQQEMLDLVQDGNLAMLESMERALKTYDPISTLCRIARRAMIQACVPPEKRWDQHPKL